MQSKTEKCILCGLKAAGKIGEEHYCSHHFKNLVVTKPILKTNALQNRNEICACNSGKKFKHCCGIKATSHTARHYFNSEYINQKPVKAS